MNSEDIEIQLWEYIDGTCTEADKSRIAGLIASNAAWHIKYDELSTMHAGISANMEAEQPSMRFSKNVMEAVAATHVAPAARQYINKKIVMTIAGFFIVTIVSILGYAVVTADYSATSTTLFPKLALPKLNYNEVFTGTFFNTIIGINIVLGLLLADVALKFKSQKSEAKS